MAFDFFNIQKPGKGVEKREYVPRFELFWELLWRKGWLMVKTNFLYLVTSILALIFIWFGFATVSTGILATFKGSVFLSASTLYLSVIGIGFIMPGLSFLTRYFVTQRHVFLFSDYFEQIFVNFKKSIILFIADSLIIYLSTVAYAWYSELSAINGIMLIPLGILTAGLTIYFMMHFYIYPIMVTFDLGLRDVLKNSLLLTLAHLPWNLLILFIISAISFLLYFLNITIGLIIAATIGIAMINFIVNFMVDPIIYKHLYVPAEVIAESELEKNDE